MGLALDVYCNYEKLLLLAGDFNIEENEGYLHDFLLEYNAKNLVKEPACFKRLSNPSCIDPFLTNCHPSFQNMTTVSIGLSDFHKMAVTVMKTTFPKSKPKIIQYRDYKRFGEDEFRRELKAKLEQEVVISYAHFDKIFLDVLNNHAPLKGKFSELIINHI